MADVSTYRRCIMNAATSAGIIHEGDVRKATDAVVLAAPDLWVPLTDTELGDSAIVPE